jgi:hypothetical protein
MTFQNGQRVTLTEDGAHGTIVCPYNGMPGVDSYVVRLDGSDRTLAVMAHHLTPDTTWGASIDPHAVGTLREATRSLLSRGVRVGTVSGDTGRVHGPVDRSGIAPETRIRQRVRYARRCWAQDALNAVIVPDTAHEPMPVHGPETDPVAHDLDVLGDLLRPDCGCGWGKLCDGPRHAGRCVCRWQQVARDDMSFGPGDLRYDGYPDPDGIQTFDSGRMHGPTRDDLPGAAIADAMRLAATDPNAARVRMRDLRAAMGDDAFEAAKASAIAHLQTR